MSCDTNWLTDWADELDGNQSDFSLLSDLIAYVDDLVTAESPAGCSTLSPLYRPQTDWLDISIFVIKPREKQDLTLRILVNILTYYWLNSCFSNFGAPLLSQITRCNSF